MKKIISLLLTLVMVVSCVQFTGVNVAKAATASDWATTAITAPTQDDLIGAGYIDIKWNNDLEDVSQYKIYIDKKLVKTIAATTAEVMKYEMYTVQVSAHYAQIVAVLKDGTEVKSAERRFYVTKKGICVNTRDMGAAVDPADLNLGWYYSWGRQSFKESEYQNTKFYDLEFVPMVWGEPNVSFSRIFEDAQAQDYKYMLAYNEPDLSAEANVPADTMALRWRNGFMKYKGNMRLGSPAPSTANVPVESKWWEEYWWSLTSSERSNTSFIAFHRYCEKYNAESAYDFLMLIDETYAKYKKPIWVTEFAVWNTNKNNPTEYNNAKEFMKIVCKGLNERSYVERYSWFSPSYTSGDATGSALFDYATGQLSEIGKIYAQIGNPAGYSAKTYGVNSTTSANTSMSSAIGKHATNLYAPEGKKKAFRFTVKTVRRASGYQIQYGTKKNMKGSKTKTYKKNTAKVKVTFTKKQKRQIKKNPKKYKRIKYYVRARAFKTINGKKYYYAWSKKVSVKVKTK